MLKSISACIYRLLYLAVCPISVEILKVVEAEPWGYISKV